MPRFSPNKPPTTMGPAQRQPLARRTNDELNARQRHQYLVDRVEGACLGDPSLRAIVVRMVQDERKNIAEVALELGIPE